MGSYCKRYTVCPMKYFYEKGQLDPFQIESYCSGDWTKCVRYRKEEDGEYYPYWMLPDGSIDENLKTKSDQAD